jgi:hypothetical protein
MPASPPVNPYIHKQVTVNVDQILGINPEHIINVEFRMEQLTGSFSLVYPQTDAQGNQIIMPYSINDFVASICIVNGINFQGFIDDITENIGSQGILFRVDGTLIPRGARNYKPFGIWAGLGNEPFRILGLSLQESKRHTVNYNYKPFDDNFKGFEIKEVSGLTFKRAVKELCDRHNLQYEILGGIDYKMFKYYYSGENVLNALEELAHMAGANCVLTPTGGDMIVRIIPWGGSSGVSNTLLWKEDCLSDLSITRDKPNYTHLVVEPSNEMTPYNSAYFGPLEKVSDISVNIGPTGLKDKVYGDSWGVPRDQAWIPLEAYRDPLTSEPYGTDEFVDATIHYEKNQDIGNLVSYFTGEPAAWHIAVLSRSTTVDPPYNVSNGDTYDSVNKKWIPASPRVKTYHVRVRMVKRFSSVIYEIPHPGKDIAYLFYLTRETDRELLNINDPDYDTFINTSSSEYTDQQTYKLKQEYYGHILADRKVPDIRGLYAPDVLEPVKVTTTNRLAYKIQSINSGITLPSDYLTTIPNDGVTCTPTGIDYVGTFRTVLIFSGRNPYFTKVADTMGVVNSKENIFFRTAAMGTAKFTKNSNIVYITAGVDFNIAAQQPGVKPKFKSLTSYLEQHVFKRLPASCIRADKGVEIVNATYPNIIEEDMHDKAVLEKWSYEVALTDVYNGTVVDNHSFTAPVIKFGEVPLESDKTKADPNRAYIQIGWLAPVSGTTKYSLGPEVQRIEYTSSAGRRSLEPGITRAHDSGYTSRSVMPVTAQYSMYAFPRRVISGAYTMNIFTGFSYMSWEVTPYSDTTTIKTGVEEETKLPEFNPKRIQSNLIVDYVYDGNNPPPTRHLYDFTGRLRSFMNELYYRYSFQTYLDPAAPLPTIGGMATLESFYTSSIISMDLSISNSQGAILTINAGRFPIP